MDKPVYTQEAMHNAIRQVVEEKRRLEEENKRLRDTVLHICEDKCMHEYGPGFCESCPAYEVVKEERGGE